MALTVVHVASDAAGWMAYAVCAITDRQENRTLTP